mmetsp:Transcript_4685/g.8796  ORF Transcript_4685/g.8796 Transcript_4685/m.8796 type:complete len:382 (-) Transcript_4685:1012-2157(-)
MKEDYRWFWCGLVAAAIVAFLDTEPSFQAQATESWDADGAYCQYDPQTLGEKSFDTAYEKNATSQLKMVVVVSSFAWPPAEDLSWLNEQPWPVFVSTKAQGHGYHSEPWGNVGWDVASYLRFIVHFWEVLPERIAFVHGHNMAWHQAGYKMSYILRNLCWDRYDYVSLNTNPQDTKDWKSTASSRSGVVTLVEEELGDLTKKPTAYYDRCCQQFLVSRAAIKSRPLQFWQTLLALMTDRDRLAKNRVKGVFDKRPNMAIDLPFMEEAWHHIFNQPKIVQRKVYGMGLDINMETGEQMITEPHHSLARVAQCPVMLCQDSDTCRAKVLEERQRGASLPRGSLADGADVKYWKVERKKQMSASRDKRRSMDSSVAQEQLHDLA